MVLDLMGEKMLSNQLLTGQEVGGALALEDAGNIPNTVTGLVIVIIARNNRPVWRTVVFEAVF